MTDETFRRPWGFSGARLLQRDRRGTVAVLTALALPAGLVLAGIGLDVSRWGAARLDLQRVTDLAALAGAGRYASAQDASAALAAAADAAEANGLPAGTRAGAPSPNGPLLTDASASETATFTMLSGPARVAVTIRREVPLGFTAAVLASAAQTVSATSVAEVTPRTSGGEACVLGLKGDATGDTSGEDLSVSGGHNTQITLTACDLRSDGSAVFNGTPGVKVPWIIASGQISGGSECAGEGGDDQTESGAPQLPDPFASAYGGTLSAMPQATVAQPAGPALSPPPQGEAYASLSFGANTSYTLAPGVYYVAGSISIDGSASVAGSGVTLIAGGGITVNGSASVSLTAPGSGATAGLLYAATGSGAKIALNGTATQTLTGALYAPDGDVAINGNAAVGPGGCLAIVAQTVSFAGSAALDDTGCPALGVPRIYDQPDLVRLVQ